MINQLTMTPQHKWCLLVYSILLVLYKSSILPIWLNLILMAISDFVSIGVLGKKFNFKKVSQIKKKKIYFMTRNSTLEQE